MSDIILTLQQIEDFFQNLTTQMLEMDPSLPANQDKVRINWQPVGSPSWKLEEDIAFLSINNPDDPITYQRDVSYENLDINNVNQVVGYTRVHTIKWILYGPNSYDRAEKIKNGLYKPLYKEQYNKKNLFLILDVVPPFRIPELFNGQWWQRTDFSARFNEKVTLNAAIPNIVSTNITMKGD